VPVSRILRVIARSLFSPLILCVLLSSGVAQTKPDGHPQTEATPNETALLSVARIFSSDEFHGEDQPTVQWLKDGSAYLALEAAAAGKGKDIVRHDPATGDREVLVRAEQLVPAGAKEPLGISSFTISNDARRLLLFTNTRKVWRLHTRGDYWVFDRDSKSLHKLGEKAPEASLMFATFDPQGRRVAYVRANNVYVENLADGTILALTTDGSDTRINGTFDWVYEEELFLRQGFRWSPDGESIAYWQIDSSGVREYPMLDTSAGLYPKVTRVQYPKSGEQNSSCRVGVVPAAGGETRWLAIPSDPRQNYIVRMDWVPDSHELLLQRANRRQNKLEVILADVRTGALGTVLTDQDDAWVDVHDDLKWIDKGRAFTWTADRDGWRRLELFPTRPNGSPRRLTTGAFDVISVVDGDEKGEFVYFMASPDNPTQSCLYRASTDGAGKINRVTPLEQPGTHSYHFAPKAHWAFHTYSSQGRPPITELISLPDHKVVRTLVGNAKLRAKLDVLSGDRGEFFRVDIGSGIVLDGWCLKPPGFDPTKRYPVLVHVYGEPAAQNVLDHWGGETYLWHRMLAQRGYIVLSVDNRGTPAPRGRAWRKCVYGKVGILAPSEQAEAIKSLEKRWPYIDTQRVGIWGWSGGGSMTLDCIFRYPELYRAGIAVAFVADQRYYDTIYQERYMGLPSDNPEGYKDGSPISHAAGLKGDLLLIHGTGDDNVHYQNCEALVDRLVSLGKPFTMMAYPNRTHSINEGEGTRRHLFELMTHFLEQHLPPGPRE
jgi:dipeptidyl-peptidase-4